MCNKFKAALLCILSISCAAPEDPSIEYNAVLSNRSAEYQMYNEGEVSKLPTYWGTFEETGRAENEAQRLYDSYSNKMWRPAEWIDDDEQPEVITEVQEVEVEVENPIHASILQGISAEIQEKDKIIQSLQAQIATKNSCTLNGERIEDGTSFMAYSIGSVEYNRTCPSGSIRTCNKGVLTGDSNLRYRTCSVKIPSDCWTLDSKKIKHGESHFLYDKIIERYTCYNKSVKQTCVNGSFSPFPNQYRSTTCEVQSYPRRTAEKTICPTIAEYNQMNTHNYPFEFQSCKNICFDRTGYYGSLLPESHPKYYSDVEFDKRETCFRCEMSKYSNKCFYPRDQFYVFKYTQQIDPKEVFSLGRIK